MLPSGVYKRSEEQINRFKYSALGKKQSPEHIAKRIKSGCNNGNWRGDKAGLEALHAYIRLMNPPPKECQDCGSITRLDLANITGIYDRNIENYRYLCRKCHKRIDKRTIDMSNRVCSVCGGTKTRIRKHNGRPNWPRVNPLICTRCYNREYVRNKCV